MTAPVEIRSLKGVDECRDFQEVQRRVWVGEEETNIVPVHVLVTVEKNGGLLLGAFCEDGPTSTHGMVGMAMGWPGLSSGPATDGRGGRVKFCSHIVGVLPQWHGRGIGVRLKLAQRNLLLSDGAITWATWTYDPLQPINANLNIHRLGATCRTYLRNVYGEMNDHLNHGTPTDRCQVDWHMDSARVGHALSPQRSDPDWQQLELEILPTRPVSLGHGVEVPVETTLHLDGRPLAVPLPRSVSSVRTVSRELLLDWRYFVRQALEAAFAADYSIVDCVRLGERGWHYMLLPQSQEPFPDHPWPLG